MCIKTSLSNKDYENIYAVYHSTTMNEMRIKADLLGVDLTNVDVLIALCSTTTYHHAFWPHTAKRFTAFKNLLRYDKGSRKAAQSKRFIDEVERAIAEHKQKNFNTPGYIQEKKNLEQVIKILKPKGGEKISNG